MLVVLSGNTGAGWHAQDLARAASAQGVALRVLPWSRLRGGVGVNPLAGIDELDLQTIDALLPRAMPAGSLEQIIFRLDLLSQLAGAGVRVINPPRAIEIAVDKYLSLRLLAQAGLAVPRTVVCQRVEDALLAFDELGGDVLLKPLFGSEGFGIARITDRDLLARSGAWLARQGAVLYVQECIEHAGEDWRLLVIGGQVVAAMSRRAPGWRTNVASGGFAAALTPSAAAQQLALRAAQACCAEIAGVDILPTAQGLMVLEVNSSPGWRALHAATNVDVAAEVIAYARQ